MRVPQVALWPTLLTTSAPFITFVALYLTSYVLGKFRFSHRLLWCLDRPELPLYSRYSRKRCYHLWHYLWRPSQHAWCQQHCCQDRCQLWCRFLPRHLELGWPSCQQWWLRYVLFHFQLQKSHRPSRPCHQLRWYFWVHPIDVNQNYTYILSCGVCTWLRINALVICKNWNLGLRVLSRCAWPVIRATARHIHSSSVTVLLPFDVVSRRRFIWFVIQKIEVLGELTAISAFINI